VGGHAASDGDGYFAVGKFVSSAQQIVIPADERRI
jgi:hypothetical protein